MKSITFIDGNSGETVSESPFDEVPKPNREVYLKDGKLVPTFIEGCEVVPIVKVVKTSYDIDGHLATGNSVHRVEISEYDGADKLLRTHTMYRNASCTRGKPDTAPST